jgi:hypothetical protein
MTNPLLPWQRFGPQVVEGAVGDVVTQVENDVAAATGIQLPQVEFPTTLPPPAAAPTTVNTAQGTASTAQGTVNTAVPVSAPTAAPVTTPGGAVGSIEASIKEAIAAAMPEIRAEALNYAKAELQATLSGQQIDQAHPTITVTTSKGKELKIADAKSRSYRTFVQGLSLDVFFALVALLGTLTNFDPLAKASWFTLGALVLKTIFQTIVTYISRMKITPTTVIDGQRTSLVTIPATSVTTLQAPTLVS